MAVKSEFERLIKFEIKHYTGMVRWAEEEGKDPDASQLYYRGFAEAYRLARKGLFHAYRVAIIQRKGARNYAFHL